MDRGTASPKRLRLNPLGKALRRERIFDRLRGGWSYDAIAEKEQVTPRRIRQIVSEALQRQELDGGPEQAMLQLLRLENALRLAADAVAGGDIGAIAPYLSVLDRIDRYRRLATPSQSYDAQTRERMLAKLNRIVNSLVAETEPKPSATAPEGEGPGQAEAPVKPETSDAFPFVSPVSH